VKQSLENRLALSSSTIIGRPKRLLIVSFILTLTFIVGLGIIGEFGSGTVDRIENRYIPLERLTNELSYYDEALTHSARLAAVTGDSSWQLRYNANVVELDQVLVELRALSDTGLFSIRHLDAVETANQRLVEAEEGALALAANGDTTGASELLFGAAYEANKKTYADGLNALQVELRAAVAHDVERDRSGARGATRLAALGFVISALVFWWLWRAMDRWRRRLTELELLRQEEADRVAERRLLALTQTSADIALVVGENGRLTYISAAVERVLGWKAADLLATELLSIVCVDDADSLKELIASAEQAKGEPVSTELRIQTASGEMRVMEVSCRDRRHDERIGGLVLNAHDVTERVVAQGNAQEALLQAHEQSERLRHQAEHDILTGLSNRAAFQELLPIELGRPEPCCLLMIDIDGFKEVNDTRGHQVGDRVLIRMAERLQQVVRAGDVLARIGGDEFVILIRRANEVNVDSLVDRILLAVATPVLDASGTIELSASIGIAGPGFDSADAQAVLADADMAMYSAKNAGRNRAIRFETKLREDFVGRVKLKAEIEQAIAMDEFVVHYQPVWDLQQAKIVAGEALVRWQHPTRGLLAPGAFLPAVEEMGLLGAIDKQVIRVACKQLSEWDRSGDPALDGIRVSANVSAVDLYQDVLTHVSSQLEENELAPRRLVLELTETTIMHNVEAGRECLRGLNELGVRLALDDFGTGYSSLSQLQTLHFDLLKIDRSFVSSGDEATRSLAATIAGLAHMLDLLLVAEGIETESQLVRMQEIGCQYGQGFLFGKPMPANDYVELARSAMITPPFAPIVQGEPASS